MVGAPRPLVAGGWTVGSPGGWGSMGGSSLPCLSLSCTLFPPWPHLHAPNPLSFLPRKTGALFLSLPLPQRLVCRQNPRSLLPYKRLPSVTHVPLGFWNVLLDLLPFMSSLCLLLDPASDMKCPAGAQGLTAHVRIQPCFARLHTPSLSCPVHSCLDCLLGTRAAQWRPKFHRPCALLRSQQGSHPHPAHRQN